VIVKKTATLLRLETKKKTILEGQPFVK